MTNARSSRSDNLIEVANVAPAEVSELDLYQKREKIYTRKIEGFYQRIRLFTGWPLLTGYFVLPWLQWDGRQAVLFDLPARQFHILGYTFWPQDFALLAWILALAAFLLFFVTTIAGRLWCGYTCPQTVWTAIFMWIEQKTEGSRNQRIKLDKMPLSIEKVRKKAAKHGMWLAVAFATGFTFVAYFTTARQLIHDFLSFDLHLVTLFWVFFFTAATYLNAGWLREQVCMYMCPYARFQSAMFDENTLIVSYDAAYGEPRGSRKRVLANQQANADTSSTAQLTPTKPQDGLGACIDCKLCVQVCPTGIDIRNGLQYQCIGCALCVDACNAIMNKMGYEPNLISYTTENRLNGKQSNIIRPKVAVYATAIIVMFSLIANALITRLPLDVDVVRDRHQLYQETDNGQILNSYLVKILNKDQANHTYSLSVEGLDSVAIELTQKGLNHNNLVINAGNMLVLPLTLSIARDQLNGAQKTIHFVVTQKDKPAITIKSESRFLGPFGTAQGYSTNQGTKQTSQFKRTNIADHYSPLSKVSPS